MKHISDHARQLDNRYTHWTLYFLRVLALRRTLSKSHGATASRLDYVAVQSMFV